MGAQPSNMQANGGPPYKIAFLGPVPNDKEIPQVPPGKGRPSDETVSNTTSLPPKGYDGTFSRKGSEELQDLHSKFHSPTTNVSKLSSPHASLTLSNRGSPPATKTSKSNLLALPGEVRAAIFSLSGLPSNRRIIPYYNECSVQVPFDLFDDSDLPNISTSLLLVNRQVSAEAIAILYSSNTFTFCDARFATWFCKRIGSVNFQRINTMQLLLTTGYDAGVRRTRKELLLNTFDVPLEMSWAGFVQWSGGRHKLLRLLVSFEEWVGWGGLNVDSAGRPFCLYKEEEFALITKWRRIVVEELQQCRIGKVRIERGLFFATTEARYLRYLMEGKLDELYDEQEEGDEVVEEVESVVGGEDVGAESDSGDDTVVEAGDVTLTDVPVPGPEDVNMQDPAPELIEIVGDLVAKMGEDLAPELLEMGG